VAKALVALLEGARLTNVDADQKACAVQLVDRAGVRQLHRYYVSDGVVHRIVVQGTT
jgi:hypothetical protein